MKFLKCLLAITIFFFSCNEKCDIPECPRPNLNGFASLTLQFCMDVDDESCFSNDELGEVVFIQKRISTGDLISSTSLTNLEENNFSIQIGGDSSDFLFIDQIDERYGLLEVEYFYEIEVVATGDFFTIKNLKRKTDGDPCSCPSYSFESAKVNDSLIEVIEETIVLKK